MNNLITFDFDYTLFKHSDEKVGMLWAAQEIMVPIQPIHDLLWEKHKEGYIIDIVTSRDSYDVPEVQEYVKAHNLPIRFVECTRGKCKTPVLKGIGSTLHIDDMLSVVIDAELNGIPCLLVDDGRHKNNTTADQFDKILV
jgi:hypothetical protein